MATDTTPRPARQAPDPDRLDALLGRMIGDLGATGRRAVSSSATGSGSLRRWRRARDGRGARRAHA